MDSETEGGCEPSPAPSLGQGCPGGSVSPGGGEVLSGETPSVLAVAPVLKVGDIAYLRYKGELLRVVVEYFQKYGGAINVSNGNGEYIVARGDLITEAEHLANLFEENKNIAARENARVLEAYPLIPATITKTSKRNKWLAEHLKMTPRDVAGAVRSLAHWKLIELTKDKDEGDNRDL